MDGSADEVLAVDAASLSYDEQIALVSRLSALESRAAARRVRALAAVCETAACSVHGEVFPEFHRDELSCLLGVSPLMMGDILNDAQRLAGPMSATLELVESGTWSMFHARAVLTATAELDWTVSTFLDSSSLVDQAAVAAC